MTLHHTASRPSNFDNLKMGEKASSSPQTIVNITTNYVIATQILQMDSTDSAEQIQNVGKAEMKDQLSEQFGIVVSEEFVTVRIFSAVRVSRFLHTICDIPPFEIYSKLL
jgi:hypothetical protein